MRSHSAKPCLVRFGLVGGAARRPRWAVVVASRRVRSSREGVARWMSTASATSDKSPSLAPAGARTTTTTTTTSATVGPGLTAAATAADPTPAGFVVEEDLTRTQISSIKNVPRRFAVAAADSLHIASELSKARLSGFVAITALAGYAASGAPILEPLDAYLQAAAQSSHALGDALATTTTLLDANPSVVVPAPAAILATVGTFGCSACANALNQIYEKDRDASMHRTKRRPLPSGLVSETRALLFAGGSGIGGVSMLGLTGSCEAALLGAFNIVLYAGVYTPMKPMTEWNTWAGAIVGAVPPLIGWCAASPAVVSSGDVWWCASEPWLLALALYLWQFPHFFALAWRHRVDYATGGYAMIPVADTTGRRTADLCVRYAFYSFAVPIFAVASGATGSMFALEGAALNFWLVRAALAFRRSRTQANATRLFRATLVYLPLLLFGFVLHSTRLKNNDGTVSSSASSSSSTSSSSSSSSSSDVVPIGAPAVVRVVGPEMTTTTTSDASVPAAATSSSRETLMARCDDDPPAGSSSSSSSSSSTGSASAAGKARTLGDAVAPLRDLGRAACVHELLAQDRIAKRPTAPTFCPLESSALSTTTTNAPDAAASSSFSSASGGSSGPRPGAGAAAESPPAAETGSA